jgi:biotin operon repressor
MRRRQKNLPFALGASIRNPFSRELLRRCVLAQRPVSLDELAESMGELRSTIRQHAEELEILGALKVSEELWPWRPSGYRYEATELLMNSEWALGGLGLLPGDRWLTDGIRAEIDKHIAERRKDKEFTERLRRRMEEDRDVLEALAGPDVPVRLWRRALASVRSRLKRRPQKAKARRRPSGSDRS